MEKSDSKSLLSVTITPLVELIVLWIGTLVFIDLLTFRTRWKKNDIRNRSLFYRICFPFSRLQGFLNDIGWCSVMQKKRVYLWMQFTALIFRFAKCFHTFYRYCVCEQIANALNWNPILNETDNKPRHNIFPIQIC